MHSCQKNPERSCTEKKKLSIHLVVTHCLQIVYLMKQKTNLIVTNAKTMERFCKDVREHAMKINNFQEKKMVLLTDKENKVYENQKVNYIRIKESSTDEKDKNEFKLYRKVGDHCYYTENLEELFIAFAI